MFKRPLRRIEKLFSGSSSIPQGSCNEGSVTSACTRSEDNWFSPKNSEFPYDAVYTPLNRESNEIRLLSLLPAEPGNDTISCRLQSSLSLHPTALASRGSYEALSYCAGDPKDVVSISLNGHTFNVFRSLYGALKNFRLPDAERVLWVDQICINQTDITERGSQVLLMKDVYERASCTLIWLGEPTLESDAGFDLVESFLAAHGEVLRGLIRTFDSYDEDYLHSDRKCVAIFDSSEADYLESYRLWESHNLDRRPSYGPPSRDALTDDSFRAACHWVYSSASDAANAAAWDGLTSILRRPWWTRCWIFQEVMVSANLHIHCGPRSILWDDLVLLGATVRYRHLIYTGLQPDLIPWNACSAYGRSRSIFEPHKLCTSLTCTRRGLASDPRDKVYSLLSLLPKETRAKYGIQPDYVSTNTKEDVYIAAAKAIMLHESPWHLFGHLSGSERAVGLPSWAPDWSQPMLSGVNSRNLGAESDAGGSSIITPQFMLGDRIIKVVGFYIGVVNMLGLVDGGDTDWLETQKSWVKIVKQMMGNVHDLKIWTDFFRTLHMDKWLNQDRYFEPQDVKQLFEFWLPKVTMLVNATNFDGRGRRGCLKQRFMTLDTKWMGLAPAQTQVGDVVYILPGSDVPSLFRRTEDNCIEYHLVREHDNVKWRLPQSDGSKSQRGYMVVGECFVTNLMHGEILEKFAANEIDPCEIVLE